MGFGSRWSPAPGGCTATTVSPTLGQVVEDVTGEPFDRYLREHVFDPLGMDDSDLVRPPRAARPARDRIRPAPPTDSSRSPGATCPPGRRGVYSTTGTWCATSPRFSGGGSNEHGRVLRPETSRRCSGPTSGPIRGFPAWAWASTSATRRRSRLVGKDGVVSGFLRRLGLAPDDDIGVIVLANTGGLDARGAPTPLALAIMRHLLGLPGHPFRTDLAPHPEVWADLCGWYGLAPGPMTNLFMRLVMGAGAEVPVRDRRAAPAAADPDPRPEARHAPLPRRPRRPLRLPDRHVDMGRPPLPSPSPPPGPPRAGTAVLLRPVGPPPTTRRAQPATPHHRCARRVGATAAAIRAAVRHTTAPTSK